MEFHRFLQRYQLFFKHRDYIVTLAPFHNSRYGFVAKTFTILIL